MKSKPLNIGAVGDEVADLHRKLRDLGFEVPASEAERKFFGPGTRLAIGSFQRASGITESCELCERTLTELALPSTATPQPSVTSPVRPADAPPPITAVVNSPPPFTAPINIAPPPNFLFKPEVLFGKLAQGSSMPAEMQTFTQAKLNERLRAEILNRIGAVTEEMTQAVITAISRLDYQSVKDTQLSTLMRETVLAEVKKSPHLTAEATTIENRLGNATSAKVSDVLYLDVPLKENPIFSEEVRRARVFEYARLSHLDNHKAQKLIEKGASLYDVTDAALQGLIAEGILTPQQQAELKFTVELGKLTNDNVPLISALKSKNLTSVADLVGWEKTDWQRTITAQNIVLPAEATAETYAETITFIVERAYPTQFLLHRLLSNRQTPKLGLLSQVNHLLQTNDKLVAEQLPVNFNWSNVAGAQRQALQETLHTLTEFANTYRHLGIGDLINNKNLDVKHKKEAIQARLQSLDTFVQNNPQLDLRTANFFDKNSQAIKWDRIPKAERPLVKKQMMAYQRVMHLAENSSDRQVLLGKGYDSAIKITQTTRSEFALTSGLDEGTALMTYERASEWLARAVNTYAGIRDVTLGDFRHLRVANLTPTLINELREIDGYDDLFGPQDFCYCEECRSILSPAAYFVDLMLFIERHVPEKVFTELRDSSGAVILGAATTSHLYLKRRRGDLWKLKLTCENTHTLIPYLTIVNEVLENYLQTEVVRGNIYEQLSFIDQNISFHFPFNLPLEELRIYLGHFGLTLHDVYQLLDQPEEKIWRARLKLSLQEFILITTDKHTEAKHRYGNPTSLAEFPVNDYKNQAAGVDRRGFINYAGITREQLDQLLTLKFHPDLNNIKVIKKQPDAENLVYFPEFLTGLTDNRLDFIHRFIRLWKKTPWSIPELDLILTSLSKRETVPIGAELSKTNVTNLAKILELQEKLKLKVEEICALVHQIPASNEFPHPPASQTDRRLFERLFDVKKLYGDSPADSFVFYHYSLNKTNPADKTIDPKTPILLAGLGISETELLLLFELLKDEMSFDDNGKTNLNLEKVSSLYRHARLARALRLSIEDFIQALHIIFPPASLVVKTLDQMFLLKEFRGWLKSSPFNVSELRFILKGEEGVAVKYRMNLDSIGGIVRKVQEEPNIPLKVIALKTHLSQSINLTADNLENILKWVSADINGEAIQTALNTAFIGDETADPPQPLKPENPDDLLALRDLTGQIERVLSVFSNLRLKEESIAYLTAKASALGITNLKNLTLDNLKALTFYKKLIALEEEAEPSVQTVLDSYQSSTTFTEQDVALLAELWKQDKSLIESLKSSLSLPPSPLQAIERLQEGLSLCKTLGINGYSLQKLALESGYSELVEARDVALGAFSSKYHDEQIRQDKLEPYQDSINVIKRDALCNYIIAREEVLKFKDRSDIYAFFLLDVEMSGCFRTSRIVAGISSLQLYIQRILVNLEQSTSGDVVVLNRIIDLDEFKQEWEWRKNYRVWEANRKVFLYSENYIEPDLRDNKTPIFKELEEELLQEKITRESAEAAYKKYLSQFSELARLRIAGSYYHEDSNTYYFFGRTQQDPPQFYYRKWVDSIEWTPWEKIEISIDADYVSPVLYLNQLFIFWTNLQYKQDTKIENGNSIPDKDYYVRVIKYSYLEYTGKWACPQNFDPQKDKTTSSYFRVENEDWGEYFHWFMTHNRTFGRIYPVLAKDGFLYFNYIITGRRSVDPSIAMPHSACNLKFDIKNNQYKPTSTEITAIHSIIEPIYYADDRLRINAPSGAVNISDIFVDYHLVRMPGTARGMPDEYWLTDFFNKNKRLSSIPISRKFPGNKPLIDLSIVHNSPNDAIARIGAQDILIRRLKNTLLSSYIRLSTSLADEFGAIFFNYGIDALLDINTQQSLEDSVGIALTYDGNLLSTPPVELASQTIDYLGPYGNYYSEMFFHIPFLIANHLNANQKFKEAKWWYERIFDPTSTEPPDASNPTQRNWRYIEFRKSEIETLQKIVSNDAAIEQYKRDPFNPHAIARLRLSAYPKSIVMKYIDNLLDWGDSLFAQDTMESINEATMLYVLAADILGKRPVRLGKCDTVPDDDLTYEKIGPAINQGSEFFPILESWDLVPSTTTRESPTAALVAGSATGNRSDVGVTRMGDGEVSLRETRSAIMAYSDATRVFNDPRRLAERNVTTKPYVPVVRATTVLLPAFCIPPNDHLLKYWDRVEDRLFKIRNCRNINGVRRQLALFQPPIDPMMLVRARAVGLSLEDILATLNESPPPYRFSYLIEKAKQFTQTVQSFGGALLSALEKKDVEELTLLRSVHERNILRMTKEIKKQQVKEAQHQHQAMVETRTNVQNRIEYYQGLIDEGLTGWEITQQISKHAALYMHYQETQMRLGAAVVYLAPQVGSPLAMKYGGKEIGDSISALAGLFSSLATIGESISSSAGLEATFQRREQEWRQQWAQAQQELKQVERQVLAAEVRVQIAEKDLEIHETNIEQANELHEFYKNKFTNLGLYNYLSTNLNRLYREAYNVAHDMAKMAERAYKFERDDDTFFIANDNWQFDRAGLLAGERLLLQLQRMEKAYIESHTRDQEITQSFSLALLNPAALLALKQTGNCDITIPEIAFDLSYPGQYKRIIKSVRLTIPCVTGPYTNVSAKLTLTNSSLRRTANLESAVEGIPIARNTSITASSAQNDTGMFEFNFRDERYLPFEGAGAISEWRLELPFKLRMFDYNTISDVIVHISYTAKDDGAFKVSVEDAITDTLTNGTGLFRLISLKHEFPTAFHKLLNSTDDAQITNFDLTRQHFPYFLADRELLLSGASIYLKPKGNEPFGTLPASFFLSDAEVRDWSSPFENSEPPPNNELKEGIVSLSGDPIKTWAIKASATGWGKEMLDDILILLKYTVSA